MGLKCNLSQKKKKKSLLFAKTWPACQVQSQKWGFQNPNFHFSYMQLKRINTP